MNVLAVRVLDRAADDSGDWRKEGPKVVNLAGVHLGSDTSSQWQPRRILVAENNTGDSTSTNMAIGQMRKVSQCS